MNYHISNSISLLYFGNNEDLQSIKSIPNTDYLNSLFEQNNFDSLNHNLLDYVNEGEDINKQKKNINDKISIDNLQESNLDINNNKSNISKFNKFKTKNNKNMGRKRIEDKNEYKHNKKCEDNMMRKIKTNFMEYILNKKLNCDKSYKFYRINKNICENLKRDFNLKLMDTTIKDIFYDNKISRKYRSPPPDDSNQTLINKIIGENIKKDIIGILNMTFYELIIKIRDEEQDKFFEEIKKKEKNMKKNVGVEEYIESLKDLFSRYYEWFDNKKGRNTSKQN